MTGSSPTIRQRELGKRLRELRIGCGFTVEEVADKLFCSVTKISRLETGTRRPSLRDVRDLCAFYNVDESTATELMELARGSRELYWWTQYEDLDMDPYLGLEVTATTITSYTMYYVPALLQTEEYARGIISAIAPKMDPEVIRQRIEARLRRQQLLEQDSRPRYHVFLDEAVLHRQVGGPALMDGQLQKVLDAGRDGKVTFQVVPFQVGAHAAQDSNFVFFEFEDDSGLSSVVFVEGLAGNQYMEGKAAAARYREAIGYLRDSALTPRDSLSRIAEIKSYTTRP